MIRQMSRRRSWLLIVAAYFALAILYSLATPIFEASDEVSHYAVIQYIADSGELPVQRPGVKTAWEQEGSQPPLYYAVLSPLARAIDTGDVAARMYRNPHAQPGDPSLDANRNLVIHSPAENFPWQGTTLAVHLIRLISLALGAITVSLGYAIARRIFPEQQSIAIGTASLIAFNPMFLFIAASVNNDNLVIMLTSLALYLTVQCWQETQVKIDRAGWLRRVALGVMVGLAALTKISGLTLLPIIAVALTVRHLRQRDWRGWILSGLIVIVPVVAIAGWWYWRNQLLYGDWLGLDAMVAIAGPRSMTLLDLVPEFDGFRYSYWALFGAVNIVTFPLAYVIFDVFTWVSLIGFAIWLVIQWQRGDRERVALMSLLAGYGLLVFIGVVSWTMMTPASQGRLMFPAITIFSLIMWVGWDTLWRILDFRFGAHPRLGSALLRLDGHIQPPDVTIQREQHWLRARVADWARWSMPAFLLITAAVVPFRDIAPAYAGPQLLNASQVPPDLMPMNVDYGQQLRLLGYQLPKDAVPGTLGFTLYWQCLDRMDADYSVFVIVYGRDLQEVGKRDAYPYHGLYATRQCEPGAVFADPYHIPVKQDTIRPTILRVQIGLKNDDNETELAPTTQRTPLNAVIFTAGKLGPLPDENSKPQIEAHYRLGDAIELLGYDVPQFDPRQGLLKYRLYWRVSGTPPEDYTLFAHLLDGDGHLIGQGDSPPFNGDYPTSWWRAGESFYEERSVKTDGVSPLAGARLAIGLYRLSDGLRLPVLDAQGQRQPDDQIVMPAVH